MNTAHRIEQSLYLTAIHEIERVISDLSNRKSFLNKLCHEIKEKLGFEYVTIQLINREEHIIETVEGIGLGENWVGLARHYLEGERSLRDIQADIALSKRTEIISGWDDRLDPWIYNELQKGTISRINTPIILVSDENGNLVENWWEKYYKWEIVSDEITERQHTTLKLVPLKAQPNLTIEVIGTVGAGFPIPDKIIPAQDAINLNKFLADKAVEIRKFLLPYVLQTIVEYAIQVVNADSASLHFLYNPYSNNYVYEVCSGNISIPFLEDCRPRDDGLGQQAIETGGPNFFPTPYHHKSDSHNVGIDPKKRSIGIKAQAVFPLKVGEKQGVLYIYFHHQHRFSHDEIGWLEFFANRVVAAIEHTTTYTQLHNMTNQLSSLHKVSLSLVEKTPFGKKLLPFIASSARNLLAADVVVIYEYVESTQEFKVCPEIAGKLIDKEAIINENITEQSIPALLVRGRENIYSESINQEPIFSTFEREKIKSMAGILLSVGDIFLGLMLITYRRPHSFSGDEKEIIELFAAQAAIAIKNTRLYDYVNKRREALVKIGQKLTEGILLHESQVLDLIYEQATCMLGMKNLSIALYDEPTDTVRFAVAVVDGKRVENIEDNPGWGLRKGLYGKTERVIQSRNYGWLKTQKEVEEADFSSTPGHRDSKGRVASSWIGVPMIANMKVLGVFANYEYGLDNFFNNDDVEILQALADQAAIAIDNARLYSELTQANEELIELDRTKSKFLSTVSHELRTPLAPIKSCIENLLAQVYGPITEKQRDRLERALKRTNEEARLIENLLSLVRIQEGRIKLKSAYENMTKIVNDVIQVFEYHANIKQIKLEVEFSRQEDLETQLDREKIKQVLSNLIGNAVKFTPEGGTITVYASSNGQQITTQVKDTGIGIPENELEKIFDRFYQVDSSLARNVGGTGIGLNIAKEYIELHKGKIWAESTIGQGTTFTFMLPKIGKE